MVCMHPRPRACGPHRSPFTTSSLPNFRIAISPPPPPPKIIQSSRSLRNYKTVTGEGFQHLQKAPLKVKSSLRGGSHLQATIATKTIGETPILTRREREGGGLLRSMLQALLQGFRREREKGDEWFTAISCRNAVRGPASLSSPSLSYVFCHDRSILVACFSKVCFKHCPRVGNVMRLLLNLLGTGFSLFFF